MTPDRVVAGSIAALATVRAGASSVSDPSKLDVRSDGEHGGGPRCTGELLDVLDAADGTVRWSVPLPFTQGAGSDQRPASGRAIVVAAWAGWEGGHLEAFDLASGFERGRSAGTDVHRNAGRDATMPSS